MCINDGDRKCKRKKKKHYRASVHVRVREVSVSLVVLEMFTRVIPVEKTFADDASVRRRIKRKREGSVEEDNKRTEAKLYISAVTQLEVRSLWTLPHRETL